MTRASCFTETSWSPCINTHSGSRRSVSKIRVLTTACSGTPSASLDARVPPRGSYGYRCGTNAIPAARSARIAMVTGCLDTAAIIGPARVPGYTRPGMEAHDLSEHVHHEDEREHNRVGERRTWWVVAITAAMMVGELLVGWRTDSVALKADGWHMGTHVGALGLTLVAYWYARTRAGRDTFSFATGKTYPLPG